MTLTGISFDQRFIHTRIPEHVARCSFFPEAGFIIISYTFACGPLIGLR